MVAEKILLVKVQHRVVREDSVMMYHFLVVDQFMGL